MLKILNLTQSMSSIVSETVMTMLQLRVGLIFSKKNV
jgi:hypothetical protein